MKLKRLERYLKDKGLNFIICTLLASLVLSIGVSSITLVILYVLSISLILFQKKVLIVKPIDILYFIFFISQAITFFWSENTDAFFNEIEKLLIFIFIPLLFIYIRSNDVKLNINSIIITYLFSLIIFGIILISYSVYDIIINNKPFIELITKNVRFNLIELSPISFHTPFLGMFLILGIILSLFIKSKNILQRGVVFFMVLFFLFLLYLNSNLSSFISLFLVGVLILLFKLKRRTLLVVLAIFFGISLIFILLFFNEIQNVLYYDPADGYWETPRYRILRFIHEGDPTRRKIWETTIGIIKDNFWFGVGIGDLTDTLQSFRGKDTYAYINRLNVHNQYLSIFGTSGFLGFLLFLLLIINNILLAIKNKSKVFYSFIIITLFAFLTENILSRQWGLIFFCIFNYLIYEHINSFKGKT